MTVVASSYARQANDLYQTEPWATEAALRHIGDLLGVVWEPAAGNHLMADVMRDRGLIVFTSDIVTYDRDHDDIINFLEGGMLPVYYDDIMTNPPYGKGNRDAEKFARLCLRQCTGYIALLLTAKFDSGSTRVDLFRDSRRFMMKIVLIDRISWFGGGEGTEDHCWYIWGPIDRPQTAPIIIYEGKEP